MFFQWDVEEILAILVLIAIAIWIVISYVNQKYQKVVLSDSSRLQLLDEINRQTHFYYELSHSIHGYRQTFVQKLNLIHFAQNLYLIQ